MGSSSSTPLSGAEAAGSGAPPQAAGLVCSLTVELLNAELRIGASDLMSAGQRWPGSGGESNHQSLGTANGVIGGNLLPCGTQPCCQELIT